MRERPCYITECPLAIPSLLIPREQCSVVLCCCESCAAVSGVEVQDRTELYTKLWEHYDKDKSGYLDETEIKPLLVTHARCL